MKVREAISRMGFYDPPLEERGNGQLLLDFNESTLPPPRGVIATLVRYLEEAGTHQYPSYAPLIGKLSRYAGVDEEQIILTNGSDQAIDVILRALLEPGDEMIFARPGFAMFPQVADTLGVRLVSPSYREDMSFPYEEILAAVTPKTRLIALIDPNNPTGTAIGSERIGDIVQRFPDIPVLVDEAYFEFTDHTSVNLLGDHSNLVIIRTFSKFFAMAGLRLGYALSNGGFIRELYKIRGPYDPNAMAVKGAEAALDHLPELRKYGEEVMTRAKPMVESFFDERGVSYFPGAANFMLVRPDDVGAVVEFLRSRGILVRPQSGMIADTFRLSIGTVADMTRFIKEYAAYLEK